MCIRDSLGPIIGSVAVLLVNESLRALQDYQMLVYGIMMLIVIVIIPGGLYGMLKNAVAKVKRRKLEGSDSHA